MAQSKVPRPILSEPRVLEIYWQQEMLSAWVLKLFSFLERCNHAISVALRELSTVDISGNPWPGLLKPT